MSTADVYGGSVAIHFYIHIDFLYSKSRLKHILLVLVKLQKHRFLHLPKFNWLAPVIKSLSS